MKRMLGRLWPPYEFYEAKRGIGRTEPVADAWLRLHAQSLAGLEALVPDAVADAEKIASSVLEAEVKRKDVLESKASTFVVTPAVATAITAAIAPLTKDLALSTATASIVTVVYGLALIHLLVSSWYAITARRAEAFVVLSAANAQRLMRLEPRERIAYRLAFVQMNEPALVIKANRLSVAEDLFLRGLAFLAFASFVAMMAHLGKL